MQPDMGEVVDKNVALQLSSSSGAALDGDVPADGVAELRELVQQWTSLKTNIAKATQLCAVMRANAKQTEQRIVGLMAEFGLEGLNSSAGQLLQSVRVQRQRKPKPIDMLTRLYELNLPQETRQQVWDLMNAKEEQPPRYLLRQIGGA
jgi:hypothetical protein